MFLRTFLPFSGSELDSRFDASFECGDLCMYLLQELVLHPSSYEPCSAAHVQFNGSVELSSCTSLSLSKFIYTSSPQRLDFFRS